MSVPELTPLQAQRLKRALWRAVAETGGLPAGAVLLNAKIFPDELWFVYVIPGDTPQPAQRVRVPLGDGWWT